MDNIKKETIVHPFHQCYLQFAYEAYQKRGEATTSLMNKNIIDTINYSFACIESFIEFLWFEYQNNCLKNKYKDDWLTRYAEEKWDEKLSLSKKIGFLTYLYTLNSFWQNDDEYQLFNQLRNIRNRLTHAYPHISGREIKVIEENSDADGSRYWKAEVLYEGPLNKKGNIIKQTKTIVSFNRVNELDISDAEKAFEILLYHVVRLENIFLNNQTTNAAVVCKEPIKLIHATDILENMECRFKNYWNRK